MYLLQNRQTFAYSAENPSGQRNGGTRGKDCEKLNSAIGIRPGETAVLCDIEGSGMINHMWFTGYIGHSFIIRIYWEGSDTPSVEAPISAFFGCAYDENFSDIDGNFPTLNSALVLVAPGRGYNSYFEMPFKKHCKITMENRSNKAQSLYYQITGWLGEVPENISYFHATYRQEHPVVKGRSYVAADNIKGKGRLLGVTFACGVNGNNACWLEGEVKTYIDGETYPSINYTGIEDYFCGSFAFGYDVKLALGYNMEKYQTYNGLYVGLNAILGGTDEMLYNTQQRFLCYRWHIKDAIYFDKGFKMVFDDMGNSCGPRYDDFTTVVFYYLEKPSPVPFELPSDKDCNMS